MTVKIFFFLLCSSLMNFSSARHYKNKKPKYSDSCLDQVCGGELDRDDPDVQALPCLCDSFCAILGDCCPDYAETCLKQRSCVGNCEEDFDNTQPCYCNSLCQDFQNCCYDYFDAADCADEVVCSDGTVTSTAKRCDGYAECGDLSDEPFVECTEADEDYEGILSCENIFLGFFQRYSVPVELLCDGTSDCVNGEDEAYCGHTK